MFPLVARKAKPPPRRQRCCAAPFLTFFPCFSLLCFVFILSASSRLAHEQTIPQRVPDFFFYFTFLTSLSVNLGASFTLSKGGAAFLPLCSSLTLLGRVACALLPPSLTSVFATRREAAPVLRLLPLAFSSFTSGLANFLYLYAIFFFCLCFFFFYWFQRAWETKNDVFEA